MVSAKRITFSSNDELALNIHEVQESLEIFAVMRKSNAASQNFKMIFFNECFEE